MKSFHASKDLEIINNLDAVLSVIAMADKDMAVSVKNVHDEMAKKHSIIPFPIFTNKRQVFSPTDNPGEGDFKLLIINPHTRELVAHMRIDLTNKTIYRVVTEE